MPSVTVKLYSVFFKTLLKHKLLSSSNKDGSVPISRPSNTVPANASFVDGVATKDINIDPLTSLSLRIFLPESALPRECITQGNTGLFGHLKIGAENDDATSRPRELDRRNSHGGNAKKRYNAAESRRSSWGGERLQNSISKKDYARLDVCRSMHEDGNQLIEAMLDTDSSLGAHDCGRHDSVNYQGYHPDFTSGDHKKLPIIIQFHGGGFVTGSKDSVANDAFCRRMAKLCDAIVIAVGYRLAPEHKYPAAFDDGFDALSWLAKQANLAECNKSLGQTLSWISSNKLDTHRKDQKELIETFGGSMIVEPWLAAHGDLSRCVLLGVSSGGNIADFVARKAVQAGRLLEPIKIVAQVLMYPFFIGSVPTRSEIKQANSYFYDKATCVLAWKLFFSDGEFTVDHPVANPLVEGRDPPLKHMPPTLTIVGELDWMKDRAIAYSEALRKVNLDAPVLEYKDGVHEFATLDFLVKSRQAEACAEDMTIWVKKYISQKGHEFSY